MHIFGIFSTKIFKHALIGFARSLRPNEILRTIEVTPVQLEFAKLCQQIVNMLRSCFALNNCNRYFVQKFTSIARSHATPHIFVDVKMFETEVLNN
jgi:hypothetical protein